jgi:hypothetical protein
MLLNFSFQSFLESVLRLAYFGIVIIVLLWFILCVLSPDLAFLFMLWSVVYFVNPFIGLILLLLIPFISHYIKERRKEMEDEG